MAVYFVYAIKSERDGRIYVGMSKNPVKRVNEHNSSDTKSTRAYRPWKLIYGKEMPNRVEACKEEKRLKSGSGREFLKSLI